LKYFFRQARLNQISAQMLVRFFVLTVLASGAVMLPVRLAAQDRAAPTATTPTSTTPDSYDSHPHGPVKVEEAEENDVYRHTALVQWIANKIHQPVETTSRIFEFVNFGIIVLAIVIPLAKFVPKALKKRSETLRQNLETARKASEDAKSRLAAVEAKLSKLDQEIASFRAEVERESIEDERRIKDSLELERVRILESAEQEIENVTAQARRGLRAFAADLAVEQAAKQINLTPEADRALLAEFTADMTGGGLN
jgi:F-type H+-transporting ATPase subunit b